MKMKEDPLLYKVWRNIEDHGLIEEGDALIVGFSGGCDSLSLLNILLELNDIQRAKALRENDVIGFHIAAVHVNHNLRGDEAKRDELFCKSFCEEKGVDLRIADVDIKKISKEKNLSHEEAGREERYRIFNEEGKTFGKYKIAVAHTLNDFSETVMLNIIRGTGLSGLSGIGFKRDNIIRPLLNIERGELEEYCKRRALIFMTDSTNFEFLYKRNAVRHKLMPVFDEIAGKSFHRKLFLMSELINEDHEFLERSAQEALKHVLDASGNIDIVKFNALHLAIRRRVVRNLLKILKGNLKGIESIHINDIIQLAEKNATGKMLCLPKNVKAAVSYGVLKVFIESADHERREAKDVRHKTHDSGGSMDNGRDDRYEIKTEVFSKEEMSPEDKRLSEKRFTKDMAAWIFDFEAFACDNVYTDNGGNKLTVRKRKSGDIISPYKGSFTKTLKKYLIDKKIPGEERDRITLVACGNEIIWVYGLTVNQKYCCHEHTKKFLKISIIKK